MPMGANLLRNTRQKCFASIDEPFKRWNFEKYGSEELFKDDNEIGDAYERR